MAGDLRADPARKKRAGTSAGTWLKRGAITVVVVVALVYGAIFFYANVVNDAPGALDTQDLSEAVVTTDTTQPGDATEFVSTPGSDPDSTNAPADRRFDGVWTPTPASEFGYRVDEVLAGVDVTAVGRSKEITGSLTIDGTTASVDATVEVENIVSGDGRRDSRFRDEIMDVENFPTANFRTTEPIEFGSIPADGEQVTATAVGELTLRGVTLPVTVEVTAEAGADSIGVLGNVPITFTDFGIDNPSNRAVSLDDDGIIEFVLVYERA